MSELKHTREQALELLRQFTTKPGLIKHGLAVEAALRAYAREQGEDEEAWGLVGLLHDFDYERWPTADEHPYRGVEILRDGIARLPARQARVFVLRHLEGLTAREIGEALGLAASTVRVHLHRAMRALRVLFDPTEARRA